MVTLYSPNAHLCQYLIVYLISNDLHQSALTRIGGQS